MTQLQFAHYINQTTTLYSQCFPPMLSCVHVVRGPDPQHLWPCSHSTVSTSIRALDCSAASHERAAASVRIDAASSTLWSRSGGTGAGCMPSRRRLRLL